jgi:hypothetical protein
VLVNEVIKRDVLDGEKAIEATKKIGRVTSKTLKAGTKTVAVEKLN